jgi:hypothetical protein
LAATGSSFAGLLGLSFAISAAAVAARLFSLDENVISGIVSDVSTQHIALAPEISTWPDENPQLIGSPFSPEVEADVGPNQQWNLDVGLANPDEWAMVVASTGGESTKAPNIHCALAVDGVVVKAHQGLPKGALCSLRNW